MSFLEDILNFFIKIRVGIFLEFKFSFILIDYLSGFTF